MNGRYVLHGELGSGGMGVVHRAEDRANQRMVAFKQLHSTGAGAKRRTLEALFEREYHALVRLKHARIVEVFDYGHTDQGPYYTMELLDGKDLQQLAPLPVREACRHLRDVASSLALIHAHRLVHRDISPRNVRLTSDGRAKLIDFGALTTFGIAEEVVGTPSCMAPEALRRLALDQRTDLFALGVTGYWALTGRHAFPARRPRDLPGLWHRAPPAPSQIVEGIPPALDALIMSMISVEPLARPANAAAVIDQLTLIAGLDPEEHEQTAESYLSSGRMVGRERERDLLQGHLARALEGKITEVVIEGPSGIGKTRLLHEANLEAQLKGFVALRADAQSIPQAFAVAASLGLQMLNVCPEVARRAAGHHAPLLAHLSPELASELQINELAALSEDPAERRARFQTALHDWFCSAASEQALLIAVDNVQAADDNSAAFLAALGQEARRARLLVLLTKTTGDAVAAPPPLQAIRKRAPRLKLAGLDVAACEELVSTLFGNVENTGRLAKLLCDRSGGNPQLCMDLVQLVVKKKIARYIGGGWVLPLELAEDELPSRAEELLAERLTALSPDARTLCEALSVQTGRIPIERCIALAENMSDQGAYRALDELVTDQILVIEGTHYAFQQAALRRSVLAQIDQDRRRRLHQRTAQALIEAPEAGVAQRIEAARHLLHAGQEVEGADLMASAARDFLLHQGAQSVGDVVDGMNTALALYEKQNRSKHEIASLLFPMVTLAFFADWRLTLKHAERAVNLGLDITGLRLAQRLSRFLPSKLALGLGLAVAAARFVPHQLRGLKFNLVQTIELFCNLLAASTGTLSIVNDLPALKRFVELVKPLRLFGKGHIASMMYDFAAAQQLLTYGCEGEGADILEELRRDLPAPAIKKALGESWKLLYGGVLYSLAIQYPFEFGTRALETAREMEELGVVVWAMAAEEIRMLHHACRGESEAVEHCRERVELFALQGNTTWQADIFWPYLLLDTEIRAGNAIGVRTIREQLSRRAKDHPSLQSFADIAHASYLTLRGDHVVAIAAFERIIDRCRSMDPSLSWSTFRACIAYAHALNAIGQHERAKSYVTEALERAGADVPRLVVHYLEPQRQLALAEAGLGNHAEAVRILDSLLAEHGTQDQPLLIGLLHKARAEIALSMRDSTAFEAHFAEMDRCFRLSHNPALIAQLARTAKLAIDAVQSTSEVVQRHALDALSGLSRRVPTMRSDVADAVRSLYDVTMPSDRAAMALRLIVRELGAKSGFLYVLKRDQGERMELAAASSHVEPPRELERALQDAVELAQRSLLDDEQTATLSDWPGSPTRLDGDGAGSHQLFVLRAGGIEDLTVVGGLILALDQPEYLVAETNLLRSIADALRDCSTLASLNVTE